MTTTCERLLRHRHSFCLWFLLLLVALRPTADWWIGCSGSRCCFSLRGVAAASLHLKHEIVSNIGGTEQSNNNATKVALLMSVPDLRFAANFKPQ